LASEELGELWAVRDEVRQVLENAGLGPTVAFEHGPSVPGREVGCGVDHAHLHVVPTEADVVAGAKRLFPEIEWQAIASFEAATAVSADGLSYIYVEDQQSRPWLAASTELPSQVIRQVIASDLGRIGDYNWRENPEPANVERTISLFAKLSA
jgi:hypothetical protein